MPYPDSAGHTAGFIYHRKLTVDVAGNALHVNRRTRTWSIRRPSSENRNRTADRKPERQIHRLTAKIGPASESAQVKMCLTPLETSGNG